MKRLLIYLFSNFDFIFNKINDKIQEKFPLFEGFQKKQKVESIFKGDKND